MQLNKNESPYLYEVRINPPKAEKKRKVKKGIRPWQGVLFFVLLMILFILIGSPLVLAGGMYGNALAEAIVFLGGTIVIVLAMNQKLSDVLPFHRPNTFGILAVVLLWTSAYRGVTALFNLIAYLFPEPYFGLEQSMGDSFNGLSLPAMMLVIAITPAVCEEAFHRGLLQYSLQSLRHKWLIPLIMGIYFGIFHTSLVRFLPMMVLGTVLAVIRQKTDNMFYAILFHFLNNAYSVIMTWFSDLFSGYSSVSYNEITGIPLTSVGISVLMAAVMPFGIHFGIWLLDYGSHKGKKRLFSGKKQITCLGIAALGLVVFGLILLTVGIFREIWYFGF